MVLFFYFFHVKSKFHFSKCPEAECVTEKILRNNIHLNGNIQMNVMKKSKIRFKGPGWFRTDDFKKLKGYNDISWILTNAKSNIR